MCLVLFSNSQNCISIPIPALHSSESSMWGNIGKMPDTVTVVYIWSKYKNSFHALLIFMPEFDTDGLEVCLSVWVSDYKKFTNKIPSTTCTHVFLKWQMASSHGLHALYQWSHRFDQIQGVLRPLSLLLVLLLQPRFLPLQYRNVLRVPRPLVVPQFLLILPRPVSHLCHQLCHRRVEHVFWS